MRKYFPKFFNFRFAKVVIILFNVLAQPLLINLVIYHFLNIFMYLLWIHSLDNSSWLNFGNQRASSNVTKIVFYLEKDCFSVHKNWPHDTPGLLSLILFQI